MTAVIKALASQIDCDKSDVILVSLFDSDRDFF